MSNNSTQNEEALAYVQVCHQSFANVKHEDATSNAVVEFLSKFVAPPQTHPVVGHEHTHQKGGFGFR